QHIVESSAPTFPTGEWVKMEIEAHGNEEIIHRVNGKEVLRYQKPQLDPENRIESAQALFAAGAPTLLSYGYIAIPAEGQPVWLRNIELKSLAPTEYLLMKIRSLFLYLSLFTPALSEKPNVLFICVDDLRPELKSLGADHIHSPAMDSLVESGRAFTR